MLEDAAAFGHLAGGRAGAGLALVDPFESVHEFWPSFCRGFGALCDGHDALILAFQHNLGTVSWPDAPPGLALFALSLSNPLDALCSPEQLF